MTFDCPCGCPERRAVPLRNPLDGGPPAVEASKPTWVRTGTWLETLSLSPSLRWTDDSVPGKPDHCHVNITDGIVEPA